MCFTALWKGISLTSSYQEQALMPQARRYSLAGREIAAVKNLNGSAVAFDWRYLAKLMLV